VTGGGGRPVHHEQNLFNGKKTLFVLQERQISKAGNLYC
jgi:hypothetical protein